MPPLTKIVWPLIQRAGPASEETTSAMSSGRPSRSIGFILAIRSIVSSSLPSRKSAVAVGPGATVLTVMSRPRSSLARMGLIASTAALLAAYAA
jgi:hypothetical protein